MGIFIATELNKAQALATYTAIHKLNCLFTMLNVAPRGQNIFAHAKWLILA